MQLIPLIRGVNGGAAQSWTAVFGLSRFLTAVWRLPDAQTEFWNRLSPGAALIGAELRQCRELFTCRRAAKRARRASSRLLPAARAPAGMPAAKKQRVAAGPVVTYGPDDPLPAAPKQPHKLTKKELKRPDPKDAEACKMFLPEFAKRLTVWRSWTNVGIMRPPPTLHELFMEVMKEKWFFFVHA